MTELETESAKHYDLTGQCSLETVGVGRFMLSYIERLCLIEDLEEIKLTQFELEFCILYTKISVTGMFDDKKIIDIIRSHVSGKSIISLFGAPVNIVK